MPGFGAPTERVAPVRPIAAARNHELIAEHMARRPTHSFLPRQIHVLATTVRVASQNSISSVIPHSGRIIVRDASTFSGELIALEGPKAAGKTRLLTAVAALLPRDSQLVLTKEPTPAFDLRREQHLHGLALAEAIAADRAQHVAEVIGPALAEGRMVICDRYILSSYVFHVPDGVPAAVVAELNREFPAPALNLVLEVPADELRRRHSQRPGTTRLQSEDPADESVAYRFYAELMEHENVPSRFVDNSTMTDHHKLAAWLVAHCSRGTR
jgi:dTMP kinase